MLALCLKQKMNKSHRSEFLKTVKKRFPELKELINQEDGLLSFELAVFIKFIQNKIDNSEELVIKECFEILNFFYKNGNKALHNTIRNAVCEDLVFKDSAKANRSWALSLLPAPLKNERDSWLKFMSYQS